MSAQHFHAVVIGAGSTGAATAHDLALRGLRVTVIERGEVASGTTGRNHCLLHSGARYVVNDPISAKECIEENFILRQIMPDALELNDGFMVAVNEADEAEIADVLYHYGEEPKSRRIARAIVAARPVTRSQP